jgi:hypothetical protein
MNNMVGYFARMTYGDRAQRDRAVLMNTIERHPGSSKYIGHERLAAQ